MTNVLTDYKTKLGDIPQTFEDEVRNTADKVLEHTLPWKGYKEAGMIQDRELTLITDYDKKNSETKKNLLVEVIMKDRKKERTGDFNFHLSNSWEKSMQSSFWNC